MLHASTRINCFRLVFCIIIFSASTIGPAHGQESGVTKVVQAFGSAAIYKDNVSAAREQAISNSLVSAVDMVVLEMVPMESLIENFQATNQILSENTSVFIQGYKVLAEIEYKKTYRVVVKATVSVADLEEQLFNVGVAMGKKTLPTILFLISESTMDDALPKYWWGADFPYFKAAAENAITSVMLTKGFAIIDPGDMVQTVGMDIENVEPDLDNATAIQLAARFGADVVVIGTSKVERTGNIMGSNVRSFRAAVDIRALETQTGTDVASASQTAVASNANEYEGSNQALLDAGRLSGEALSEQIISAWQKRDTEFATLKIIVEGTRELTNFVLFRRALTDISGVEGVKTREMRPDTSTLTVDYTGTPKSLAAALLLKTFDTFGINITEVSDEHLRVSIESK